MERVLLGQSLATFTSELLKSPQADPELLMGEALGDASLKIAYRRPGRSTMVDAAGREITMPVTDPGRAITWIESRGHGVAAVIYDARLANESRFVEAAGAAAMLHLENVQLAADLNASTRELEASRARLMEAADNERQKIERELHDGVQQQLVGLRIKLEMAAEAIEDDPQRGQDLVHGIGREMDDVIAMLRSLARAIYPPMLHEFGLAAALVSVAQRAAVPVLVRAGQLARYREDVEVAVYFCCVEALQNVAKHAAGDAEAEVRLWEDAQTLRFEVVDTGVGFDPGQNQTGHGLTNMHDRITAVGGTLDVISSDGHGTTVRGAVPVR